MTTKQHKIYGLIGHPLSHSFSKKYFTEKYKQEGIDDSHYELFDIESVALLPELIAQQPNLCGLNVTIPHKQSVIPLLDSLSPQAQKIGAVNVIRFLPNGRLEGHNTDFFGFRTALLQMIDPKELPETALVLGTGGAAKAVVAVLEELGIRYQYVSRKPGPSVSYTYSTLTEALVADTQLIINTTPLGMYPDVASLPALPYQAIGPKHYLFDLVYNPTETAFMKQGKQQGASTQNGLLMLEQQAEAAWSIWNQ